MTLRCRSAITERTMDIDGLLEVSLRRLVAAAGGRRLPGLLVQDRLVDRVVRHGQRLLQEGDRLVVRAESCRPLRGAGERQPCLRGEGIGFRTRSGALAWAAR